MAHVQIFLSTVSAEFRSYRDALRQDLDRPNVTVKVQEDFIATGTETLDKLDEYIRQCHAVIHLVGDMTGALAQAPSVAVIRQRYPDLAERLPVLGPFLEPGAPALSYTQWEAWLALYHRKVLIIAAPQDGAPRDERYQLVEDQRAAQQAHLARLASVERYPEIRFANVDRLAVDMLRSKLQDILAVAGAVTKPANLPYLSIGEFFKGRETLLGNLAGSLGPVPESGAHARRRKVAKWHGRRRQDAARAGIRLAACRRIRSAALRHRRQPRSAAAQSGGPVQGPESARARGDGRRQAARCGTGVAAAAPRLAADPGQRRLRGRRPGGRRHSFRNFLAATPCSPAG